MIYSMTGYASATREVASDGAGANGSGVGVSVELRTVNSRFLDMNFRMPEDVRVCEPQLREMLMNKLARQGRYPHQPESRRADHHCRRA